jgi:hypothetical protein
MSRPALLLLILFAVLPLFFVPLGQDPMGPLAQLNIFGHFIFFALLAWVLTRLPAVAGLSIFRQIALVIVAVTILGGSVELIQEYFGRTASWKDFGVNLIGALFGLLFFASGRIRLPWIMLRGVQVMVLALCLFLFSNPVITLWDMRQASRQFPVLGDFETRLETGRWTSGEIDREFARHGQASLKVPLETGRKYPGTTLRRSFGDWRSFSFLAFSVHNPDSEPLFLTLSIRDHEHNRRGGEYTDRFNKSFRIDQGWNDIRVSIQDIENAPAERTLELDSLSEVVFFTTELDQPRIIHLDHVRLIP